MAILKNKPGFTLVELMVASALTAIAISCVLFSWNYISRHTAVYHGKSMLQNETMRIAWQIASEIKKSPKVISWKSSGIVFFSQNGIDTVSYEFVDGNLLKNANPMVLILHGAHFSRFTIESEISSYGVLSMGNETLIITLALEDASGNACVMPLKVNAAMADTLS